MDVADARRHAEHLCDVYPTDDAIDHVGVIERMHTLSLGRAFVKV
jgi:hypothetical protein